MKLRTSNFQLKTCMGLTLVETLLYVVIVGIVIGGFITFIYSILVASERAEGNMELADAKLFIEQKLEWVLQGVQNITVPAGGGSGSTLTLTKVNFGENPVAIDLVSGVLRMQTAGGVYMPLTPQEISVSNLLFDRAVSGLHERLRVTALLTGRFATTSIDQTIVIK